MWGRWIHRHQNLVSMGPNSLQPWLSKGGSYGTSQQWDSTCVIVQQRPASSRQGTWAEDNSLSARAHVQWPCWPWAPRLLRTVHPSLLVRRGSLYCHLWFLWQLWDTKEIKYFVPQQKPGFECFSVAWYCTYSPSGVCGLHTFPLLEDTLSTLTTRLPMS